MTSKSLQIVTPSDPLRNSFITALTMTISGGPAIPEAEITVDFSLDLRKRLRAVTYVPTIVAQCAGYLQFTVDELNELQFSFLGIHFITLLVYTAFGFIWAIVYIYDGDLHLESTGNASSTEKFSWGMIFNVLTLSAVAIRICSFFKRKDIQLFYQNYNTTLTDIFLKFVKEEDVSTSTLTLNGWLVEGEQSMRYVWYLLSLIFLMTMSFMVMFALNFAPPSLQISTWKKWFVFSGIGIWSLTGVFYSAFIYWLVSIISCIQVGFRVLMKEVENENAAEDDVEHRLNTFMTSYSKLENLVISFNETFKYQIIVNLLGSCCRWIVHAFMVVITLMTQGLVFQAISIMSLVLLDSTTIVCICNASSMLTNQAMSSIIRMRDLRMHNVCPEVQFRVQRYFNSALAHPVTLSPGQFFVLCRSVITSIAALLTTYVFVLLQFQDAERCQCNQPHG